jgi:hypothetical protein
MNSFPENTLIRNTINGNTRFARIETIDEEDNFRVLRSDNNDIFTTLADFVGCHYTDTKARMPRRLNEWAACEFQKSGKWWSCEEMLSPIKYRTAAAAAVAATEMEASDSDSDYSPEDDCGESEHDSDFDDLVSEHDDESVNEPDDDVLSDDEYESEEEYIAPRTSSAPHTTTRPLNIKLRNGRTFTVTPTVAPVSDNINEWTNLIKQVWSDMKVRDTRATYKDAFYEAHKKWTSTRTRPANSVTKQNRTDLPILRRSARIAARNSNK